MNMWPARILIEYKRFDRHRNGVGRKSDATEIDIVEVPEHDAVDHQQLVLDRELVAQDRSQGLGDVTVEHQEQRTALDDVRSKAVSDTIRKRGKARVRGHPVPGQSQC